MAEEVSPLELIAYLNPRAGVMIMMPGFDGIRPADIAAHLAKLDRPQSTLARVKYAQMHELYQDLLRILIVHIAGTIITAKHNSKLPLLWPMSELALSEVCDSRACRWCRGRGFLPEMDKDGHDTGKRLDCEACDATGQYRWVDSHRIAKLNIPKDQWKQTYSHLYSQVLGVVWGWDRDVADHMELLRKNI